MRCLFRSCLLAVMLGLMQAASAQSACPALFKTLVSRSDQAFGVLERHQSSAAPAERCKAAVRLEDIEERLLHFMQQHQVGCELDVARIEQQHRRHAQAIGWRRDPKIGCGS